MKRTFSMRHELLIQDSLANINEMLHLSIRTDDTTDNAKKTMRLMRSISCLRMRLESGGIPHVEDPSIQALIHTLEEEAMSMLASRNIVIRAT